MGRYDVAGSPPRLRRFVAGGSVEVVGEIGMRAAPDYEECTGAKKHLVAGVSPHTGSREGANSFATG